MAKDQIGRRLDARRATRAIGRVLEVRAEGEAAGRDLSDIAEIEWVMNQVQSKLAKIIEETRQDVGTMRSPTPSAPVGKSETPGVRRTSLSLAGLTDAEENASWLLSPFNVRIQAKSQQLEAEEEAGLESARGPKKSKKRSKRADHDEGGSDSDSGACLSRVCVCVAACGCVSGCEWLCGCEWLLVAVCLCVAVYVSDTVPPATTQTMPRTRCTPASSSSAWRS